MQDSEEETEALQPLRMFFNPTEYTKSCKIATRCYVKKAVDTIDRVLTRKEKRWFEQHPQFRHLFHMYRDTNHKVMGMWMLLLRTACIDKNRECWFVVNGVPIRYSIREHALISGLDCSHYPDNYDRLGSLKFVERHFEMGSRITLKAVEEKLLEMRHCVDRLKMAVLFFLGSVLIGKTKTGASASSIEPFFLRAADDLDLCKTFPWGRLTFEDNLKEINHMMKHFKGVAKPTWTFPSFVIPLEVKFSTIIWYN